MRRAALLLAGLLASGRAVAQEPQFFEEPPPKPKLSLRWDFLGRYDRVDHFQYDEPLQRGRFELRPEIDFDPIDRLRIGVRAVFDYGTEKDVYPFVDNYVSRGASVERYYVLWTPASFALRAGAFGMPLFSTEMLWDRDIQTPGAAGAWESPGGAWTLAAAGFYGPQRDGDASRIAAGQVVWRAGEEGRLSLEAGASYWSYDLRDLKTVYIRENSSVLVNGHARYASAFHVADLLVRVRFPLGTVPVLVSLDGIRNFSAPEGKRLAFEGVLAVGRLGTPGDWRATYAYQYVQRDALVGAYNSDDWWWHTWFEGHRVTMAVTILPRVYLQGSFSLNRRLDQTYWINRYFVDLVKMF